jgi:apolipoprotein N-acyltransferase
MSRLRAVEHARTVVQVATSGKSAIIGPDGDVLAESGPLFSADVLVRTVPLSGSTTLATRTGPAAEVLLTVLGLLGLAIGGWQRRARQRRAGSTGNRPATQPGRQERDTGERGREQVGSRAGGATPDAGDRPDL